MIAAGAQIRAGRALLRWRQSDLAEVETRETELSCFIPAAGTRGIHVHLGMPNQRHSLLDRLGPDESVAL